MEDMILNNLSYPVLSITIFLPLAGALIILLLRNAGAIRWTAFLTTTATLIVSLPLYIHFDKTTYKMQFVESYPWIPEWNLNYTVGVDGISILFVFLSTLISILCVLVSWKSIQEKIKLFYMAILLIQTAMTGVFAAVDLFLFYIFWEAMLIPMFLLIGIWGSSNRVYAAVKFVLFTLAGSVLMLVGIIALYHAGGKTFNILELARVHYPFDLQIWLFLAFFAAFAVKVPMFPVHTWLPDAHTEAPTAGSVILAGILLKMGAYGFLRLSMPLFPDAVKTFFIPMLILSVIAIIYGAFVTMMQKDIKRLIAYSSVSHMGFVTLGIFSLNQTGMEGGILQMINHGIVTGALFMCIGIVYERTHTRLIEDYGGLARAMPIFTVFFTIFVLAGSGFPGMNYFIGEFLILSGAFKTSMLLGAVSILGIVLGAAYMSWLYYRIVLKKTNNAEMTDKLYDMNAREILMFAPLIILVFYIGVQPHVPLSYMQVSVEHLLERFNAGGQEITAVKGIVEVLK